MLVEGEPEIPVFKLHNKWDGRGWWNV